MSLLVCISRVKKENHVQINYVSLMVNVVEICNKGMNFHGLILCGSLIYIGSVHFDEDGQESRPA